MGQGTSYEFIALNIALLTISDKRLLTQDNAGDLLQQLVVDAGHYVVGRELLSANIYQVRAKLSQWLIDEKVQVIIINGGTGYGERDITPQAVLPLLAQTLDGFGELFRQLSFADVGVSALQSRACAGVANGVAVFMVPGSPNACALAWGSIIAAQLDTRTRPCSLATQLRTSTVVCGAVRGNGNSSETGNKA